MPLAMGAGCGEAVIGKALATTGSPRCPSADGRRGFFVVLFKCEVTFHQGREIGGEHSPAVAAGPQGARHLEMIPVDASAWADELKPSAAVSLNDFEVFRFYRSVHLNPP